MPHYRDAPTAPLHFGFFEVIAENFFGKGGKPLYHLDRVKERHPLVVHGVSLSIGGPEELDRGYLDQLKALVQRVRPAWVTDHFCFCGAGGAHLHDLLPLPHTEAMVERVARRARMVQDHLEVPFGLENTSSYLSYAASTMTEWEFIAAVANQADCGLLLDVNNVYVSAFNHGFEPDTFLSGIPLERVLQVHLAGHTHKGNYILDTHDGPVIEPVLALYRETLRRTGPISTLVEWDENVPTFERLGEEVARIAAERATALETAPAATTRVAIEGQR